MAVTQTEHSVLTKHGYAPRTKGHYVHKSGKHQVHLDGMGGWAYSSAADPRRAKSTRVDGGVSSLDGYLTKLHSYPNVSSQHAEEEHYPQLAAKHGYGEPKWNKGMSTYVHPDGHAFVVTQKGRWTHSSNKAEHSSGNSPNELSHHLSKFHGKSSQHSEETMTEQFAEKDYHAVLKKHGYEEDGGGSESGSSMPGKGEKSFTSYSHPSGHRVMRPEVVKQYSESEDNHWTDSAEQFSEHSKKWVEVDEGGDHAREGDPVYIPKHMQGGGKYGIISRKHRGGFIEVEGHKSRKHLGSYHASDLLHHHKSNAALRQKEADKEAAEYHEWNKKNFPDSSQHSEQAEEQYADIRTGEYLQTAGTVYVGPPVLMRPEVVKQYSENPVEEQFAEYHGGKYNVLADSEYKHQAFEKLVLKHGGKFSKHSSPNQSQGRTVPSSFHIPSANAAAFHSEANAAGYGRVHYRMNSLDHEPTSSQHAEGRQKSLEEMYANAKEESHDEPFHGTHSAREARHHFYHKEQDNGEHVIAHKGKKIRGTARQLRQYLYNHEQDEPNSVELLHSK